MEQIKKNYGEILQKCGKLLEKVWLWRLMQKKTTDAKRLKDYSCDFFWFWSIFWF